MPRHKISSIFDELRNALGWGESPARLQAVEDVRHWREWVFFLVFLCGLVLSFLTLFPTAIESIHNERYSIPILYAVLYLLTIIITFVWRIPFRVRAALGLLLIFLIGFYTLYVIGLYGSGRIWLFMLPLMSTLFMGARYGILSLIIIAASLQAFPLLFPGRELDWTASYYLLGHEGMWEISIHTFVAVCAMSLVALIILMKGMETALRNSKRLRRSLEKANQGLVREIEERQAAETALQLSEERYRRLLEASPDPIVMVSAKGTVDYANPAFEDVFGWRVGEIIGGGLPFEFDAPTEGGAADVRRRDGGPLTISISWADLPTVSPEGLSRIYVFHDVTKERRAEQDRLARQRLRAAIETAGAACHELNQPLQAVLMQSEMLASHLSEDPDLAPQAELIFSQARRMMEITYNLNRLAEYHTKQYVGDSRILDLQRSSGGAADDVSPAAGGRAKAGNGKS